jgi:hypothetical protein
VASRCLSSSSLAPVGAGGLDVEVANLSRDKIQAALSRWLGRAYLLKELEERGFAIHKHYEQIVMDQCPGETGRNLALYWDEMAREYICSCGLAKSWIRQFPAMECYRSNYLDELDRHRPHSPDFQRAPMHPCILAFETKRLRSAYALEITERLEALKSNEIELHGIWPDAWSGMNADITPIFETLMDDRGFKRQGRKYIKQDRNGLVFGGSVEFSRRPYCVQVPFRFFITHAEMRHKRDIFELNFRRIVEGFYSYEIIKSAQAGVLGFRAHVEMIDIISQSFSAR